MLKISRAGVHKQIKKLRLAGYGIKGTTNSGYILESRPDLVTSEELKYYFDKSALPRHTVFYYPETGSTQDEARLIAGKDIYFPAIAVAEEQTGSYGRRRRAWLAPKGGLWFSLVLKPDIQPDKIPQITFAASLAVCRAIEKMLGLSPLIKWPNDVTLGGKKIAGILTEMSAEVGKLNWVIVGAGVNVNNSVPDAVSGIAGSLCEAAGRSIGRAELLAGILSEFYALYGVFLEKGFSGFIKEYNDRSLLTGKYVRVDTGDGIAEGKALKVDKDGYLWLASPGQKSVKIMAGDVIKAVK